MNPVWRAALAALFVATLAHAQDAPREAFDATAPVPALPAPLATRGMLLDLAPAGAGLVAAGAHGVLLHAPDGRHWTQADSPVSAMLNRLRFVDARTGWALGGDLAILKTTDAGAHWALQHYDGKNGRPLYDAWFADAQHGIAVGAYGNYLTTDDGGTHWNAQTSALTQMAVHLNRILKLNDGSLLIAGERGLLAQSADGGAHWRILRSPYTGSFFGALAYGPRGALVFGLRGNIYVSEDVSKSPLATPDEIESWESRDPPPEGAGGVTYGWRHLANPLAETLLGGAWQVADREAVLVGVNGVVRRVQLPQGLVSGAPPAMGECLSAVLVRDGRGLAAGRRGLQDLGPLTEKD